MHLLYELKLRLKQIWLFGHHTIEWEQDLYLNDEIIDCRIKGRY